MDDSSLTRRSATIGFSSHVDELVGRKALPLDELGRVDDDDTVLHLNWKSIERSGNGRAIKVAVKVKGGGMARTEETILLLLPADGTAEVGAAVVNSEEAAIGRADDEKARSGELGHRAGDELISRADCDAASEPAFEATRTEKEDTGRAEFESGEDAKRSNAEFEKAAAGERGAFVFFDL
jgi:hypothetical protein